MVATLHTSIKKLERNLQRSAFPLFTELLRSSLFFLAGWVRTEAMRCALDAGLDSLGFFCILDPSLRFFLFSYPNSLSYWRFREVSDRIWKASWMVWNLSVATSTISGETRQEGELLVGPFDVNELPGVGIEL